MKTSIRYRSRRGQSLILVFFVLIALVGVLALTVDYGFVLLARRQMQTGVNASALEGLRGHNDSSVTEFERRDKARKLLRLAFDDDLDTSSNVKTIGAGIASSLTSGHGYRQVTFGDGHGTANLPANRSHYVYRPDDFELNLDNEPHGDMVVGFYDRNQTSHRESTTLVNDSYERDDFVVNEPSAADSTTDYVDAFLIRMRRTHDPHGLDRVADVSSNGGGLPLMLGLLSWLPAAPRDGEHDFRRYGTTVRSTAIAHASPALQVGLGNSGIGLVGVLNVRMDIDQWQFDSPVTLGSGADDATIFDQALLTVTSVGEEAMGTHDQANELIANEGFIILTAELMDNGGSSTVRVIGFGHVDDVNIVGTDLVFTKETLQPVAVTNATATLRHAPDAWVDIDATELLDTVHQFDESNELLRVPALSRSVR
ncbi:TadE/TadG family type IV pilus assembly protein [Rhodopirellula sp. JC639]|uniref:TadE/TadG family type IV pilus assembly protein n=1 Tax=Stieleria mannarensis TaxID=2755585 RepID=UPI00160068C0|nr:Tad domain-containing protein [Rhodopirellula sp. JC639]